MQFRKQGKRIQVFGYTGYDKEKRRAKVEFKGSLDAFTFNPTVGLLAKLTDNEKTELQAYVEKSRQSFEKDGQRATLKYMHSSIEKMADSLSDDEIASRLTDDDAQKLFAAWDKLARALRRRGHSRRAGGAHDQAAEPTEAPLLDAIASGAERS